ncbi:MAG: hypothetical protein GQ532_08030 [Methylomarinum sp.]|nr:hypothetical protein [Methylomarinum sp.]
MEEEQQRAASLTEKNETAHNAAPQLVRIRKAPPRMQKAFYIQEKYAEAFDDFVYKQRKKKGKKAPELAEEAIKMLLKKYGEDTKSL